MVQRVGGGDLHKCQMDMCKVLHAIIFFERIRETITKILGSGSVPAVAPVTKGG